MKKKKYNTNKLRTFLLFLFLACVIWVLTKFSNEYTATINCKLHYTSLPSNTVLSDGNEDAIAIDITANGFEFLMYQLKSPELEIPVSKYYSTITKQAIIDKNELSRLISTELVKAVAVRDLSVSQLNVLLDVVTLKRVPVKARTNITFKEGYRTVANYHLQPDSVTIFGAKNLLDSFSFLSTKEIVADKLDKSYSAQVPIEKPKELKINIEPEVVDFSIDVVEFTQKTLNVPIEVINKTINSTIKLIPETLTITFDISVSNFNAISAKDFKAVCDFSKKNSEENFMLVEIVRQPEGIFNLEYSDKKIDYLIFK